MSLNPNPFDRHGPRPFANCLISGVPSAVIIGTLFSGMDIAQGAKFSPKTFGTNIGFIYAYHVRQPAIRVNTERYIYIRCLLHPLTVVPL